MDNGPTPITDPNELAQVRRQARRVNVYSTVAALLATALVILL